MISAPEPAAVRRPFIIPFFIVHQGCPYRCVFCNQAGITGQAEAETRTDPRQIAEEIECWLARPRKYPEAEVQVAFYGGSFTGLPWERQEALLGAVAPFLEKGRVRAIRLSTRPDCVDEAGARFLADRGVRVVELGIQSMDAAVLAASGRGYGPEQAERAMAVLRGAGLQAGAQLMVGLPGETNRRALASVRRLAALAPDFVRLYPTLVVAGSKLADAYAVGDYRPLSLQQAVVRTARLKEVLDDHHIPVIRMGLQASTSLAEHVLAGPYHPSFGEMVLARLFFKKVRAALRRGKGGRLTIAPADESLFRGQGNQSYRRLRELGLLEGVEVARVPGQPRHTVQRSLA